MNTESVAPPEMLFRRLSLLGGQLAIELLCDDRAVEMGEALTPEQMSALATRVAHEARGLLASHAVVIAGQSHAMDDNEGAYIWVGAPPACTCGASLGDPFVIAPSAHHHRVACRACGATFRIEYVGMGGGR